MSWITNILARKFNMNIADHEWESLNRAWYTFAPGRAKFWKCSKCDLVMVVYETDKLKVAINNNYPAWAWALRCVISKCDETLMDSALR